MGDITVAIQILKDYGIWGFIAVFIYILIKTELFKKMWSYLSDKFIENFMKKKVKDLDSSKVTESDIINHDIFNYIDFWRYSKIPTINFSTEYRTAVFRKYLTIFLKGYKENLSNFAKSGEFKTMDDAQIWKTLLDLINRIIYDYEKEMIDTGIPKIIVDKMKAKNNDTITLIIDLIEGICNSHFYHSDNNYLKVYSILNIILSVLENTIQSADTVCNSINGALSGLTFEGYTEPNSKH